MEWLATAIARCSRSFPFHAGFRLFMLLHRQAPTQI